MFITQSCAGTRTKPAVADSLRGKTSFKLLCIVRAERRTRAYIEAAEWNHPQLQSLGKTGFSLLGIARKTSIFGCTFVQWSGAPGPSRTVDVQVTAQSRSAKTSLLHKPGDTP